MPKGYVIAQINVSDPDTYASYIKLVLPTIEHFGGEFLVRGCLLYTSPSPRDS